MLGTGLSILLIILSGVANLGASAQAARVQLDRGVTPRALAPERRSGTVAVAAPPPRRLRLTPASQTQTCVPTEAEPYGGARRPVAPIRPALPAPPRPTPPRQDPVVLRPATSDERELIYEAPGIEVVLLDAPEGEAQAAKNAPALVAAAAARPAPAQQPEPRPATRPAPPALRVATPAPSSEPSLLDAPGMQLALLDALPDEPRPRVWQRPPFEPRSTQARAAEIAPAAAATAQTAPEAPRHETPQQRNAPAPVAWTERLGYPITHFGAYYANQHPDAPALDEILQLEVELGRTTSGYVAAGEGESDVRFPLAKIPTGHPQVFYPGALRSVSSQIAAEFNRRGLLGVFVSPDERDIEPDTVRDLRDPLRSELSLVIKLARVKELRSVGTGDRTETDSGENSVLQSRIRRQSPVKPGSDPGGTDLVRSDLLDEYLFRVNRHPSRRVDVSLSPLQEPGGVAVDYMVAEAKPWTAYMQLSDTGGDSAGEWRQQFGLVHHQLTDRDDILSVHYVTSGFESLHSISASYSAPWGDSQHLRWRVSGVLGDFEAADVGFPNADFSSKTRELGADLTWNVFQRRQLFVDLTGGLRWQDLETEYDLFGQSGRGSYLRPHVGVAAERRSRFSDLRARMFLEPGFAGSSLEDIVQLGRTFADEDFTLLRWDGRLSFYLEPLLAGTIGSGLPTSSALAHELSLAFRGQHAFGARLVPQHQMVAGGVQSVRGYPEGAAAGDSVAIGQLQYNFRVPRLFGAPHSADSWSPADWDLKLNAFFDAARVRKSSPLSFEQNNMLAGAGLGADLAIKRHLSFRLAYGWALSGVKGVAEGGDSRIHAGFTLSY